MKDGTFAAHAQDGVYYSLICSGCRREHCVSAKALTQAGWGDVEVVGLQSRFRCKSCGHKGASLWINGHWTGRYDLKPSDWADTVEERMSK